MLVINVKNMLNISFFGSLKVLYISQRQICCRTMISLKKSLDILKN
jgi:hypothetical protein